MKVTQTIELTDDERLTVQNFMSIVDEIQRHVTNRSMCDVFSYLADECDIVGDNQYVFNGLVQLEEI